jgi:hypothetical protein
MRWLAIVSIGAASMFIVSLSGGPHLPLLCPARKEQPESKLNISLKRYKCITETTSFVPNNCDDFAKFRSLKLF